LVWTAFNATPPTTASIEITQGWNGNIFIEAHDSALVELFIDFID
jgi:hypothetical protein